MSFFELIHIVQLLPFTIVFRSFTKASNSLPKLTPIPTCFFGSDAAKYWNMKDYGEPQATNKISPKEYQNIVSSSNKLEINDLYRYPKCRKFSHKPSDTGICQTFNGLAINKILKPSIQLGPMLSCQHLGE